MDLSRRVICSEVNGDVVLKREFFLLYREQVILLFSLGMIHPRFVQ